MAAIKINKKIFKHTQIPSAEYLSYFELINLKLTAFVTKINMIIQNLPDSQKNSVEVIWDNIFQIAFFELNHDNTRSIVLTDLYLYDDIVNRKINSMYLELAIIIPPYIIDNLKYNFYTTLLDDYNINQSILNSLEERSPYIFLIHLLSGIWWDLKPSGVVS